MPLQAWGFSSRKRRPDLLVHSHSHPWPPSLEGLVSHWAVPCATSKWRTWMSPYAHTSLFICLCCEMTNVLTPALRTLAGPPSCRGGGCSYALHPSQSTRKFISGEESSGCGGDAFLPTSSLLPLTSLSLRSSWRGPESQAQGCPASHPTVQQASGAEEALRTR